MPEKPSSGLNWWQTLPGMLTGVAAIITAVTGFLVAFNHTGARSADGARQIILKILRHLMFKMTEKTG